MLRSFAATRAFSSTARKNLAKVQLVGRIGSIHHKETKDNRPFITYSLAVDRFAPNEAQEGSSNVTDWYNVTVFDDRQVAFFEAHMQKGAQIYAEADIKQKTVQDEAGEKLVYTTMTQTRYEVLRFPKKKEPETEE
ncbi:putative telomere binding protein [Metschnikowia bicuspidata var. bicuspidata NRRL YB-4993]|uniref:Single-stranded DNA-binding protein n=1 Tax=Metschnikowia bicuspidata var. bicuspidata NRRL YB-4993 TaxID=869754 RepID=A0A1A0H9Z1_9ASCO|nr:putative telomere binding protein [Metschnikowia bicuspidata var. bicuspidata NRRL YB-4993]OBA20949.1 putative telomere binding protein [Metschnikowia bicuspidata var. bicuspidata NRRL YB-4993]